MGLRQDQSRWMDAHKPAGILPTSQHPRLPAIHPCADTQRPISHLPFTLRPS